MTKKVQTFGKRYGKRRHARQPGDPVKYVSPARRREPWTTVTVRSSHYAMMRELGELWQCSVGMVCMRLVEKEFKKVLWEQEHADKMKKVGAHAARP
jgi:hypothetical protein